jgi:GTPase SAR1 family protein
MTDLKTHAPESIAKVLIGNKADLCAEDHQARKVPLDLAKTFALENDMEYFEVSAKTGQQVEESFM